MKTLTILLVLFPTFIYSQSKNNPFVGEWLRTNPDTVILQIIEFSADSFEFNFTRYNPNSYGYLGGDEYSNKKYANFKMEDAHFQDLNAICDGRPLYYEGEEPCELWFSIKEQTIEIHEENCRMIYGGAGVIWSGIYKFFRN